MFAAAATFALIASASAAAPLLRGNGDVIPGQYMVMFHKTSTLADRDAHYAKLNVSRAPPLVTHLCCTIARASTRTCMHVSLIPSEDGGG
jgi:hypothetical protein